VLIARPALAALDTSGRLRARSAATPRDLFVPATPSAPSAALLALVVGALSLLFAARAAPHSTARRPSWRAIWCGPAASPEPGRMDVILGSDALDLDVRRVGLDRDPGWLPGCAARYALCSRNARRPRGRRQRIEVMDHARERSSKERAERKKCDSRQRTVEVRAGPTLMAPGLGLDGIGNRALLALVRSGQLQRKARWPSRAIRASMKPTALPMPSSRGGVLRISRTRTRARPGSSAWRARTNRSLSQRISASAGVVSPLPLRPAASTPPPPTSSAGCLAAAA